MKKKIPLIVSLLVLSLSIFIKISNFSIVQQLQLKTFDTLQQNYPRIYTDQQVKIIDIDDESLEKIGQWPWPRNKIAEIVNRLTTNGVASIAMDIVFAEEDRTSPKSILPLWNQQNKLAYLLEELPDHDDLLANSILNSNVATGFVLTHNDTGKIAENKAGYSYAGSNPKPFLTVFNGFVPNLSKLEKHSQGNGALNSITDSDGILRRMPLMFVANDTFTPSLMAESLRIAQGAQSYIIKSVGASDEKSYGQDTGITAIKIGNFEVPTDATGKFWIYYTKFTQDRYIPAWKILDPDFDISFLEGQIAFIGGSAKGLRDIRTTPLNQTTTGVEVHVQALEQILSNEFLHRPDWMHGAEIILMITIGIILIIMMSRLSAIWGAVFTLISLSSAVAISWYSFIEYKMLIDPITPGIAIALLYLSESMSRYISAENERRQVRNAFNLYMSPALVSELAKNPDSLKLGGETKNLTILFCDIRGFTRISEQMNAQDLIQLMNSFLTPMTNIILKHKGTIDKYMGDCIMAFWNAPLDDLDHAQNACLSALEMVDALKILNKQHKQESEENNFKFIELGIGIGLNTGYSCVGNMGSEQRFDYSVLGDDVNLASRLEGQSKYYGVEIVIGGNTLREIKGLATLELDLIQVKGKNEPVKIYTILNEENLISDEIYLKFKKEFDIMLTLYRSQKWDESLLAIQNCKDLAQQKSILNKTLLFELYERRIDDYKKSPPSDDWSGIYVALNK